MIAVDDRSKTMYIIFTARCRGMSQSPVACTVERLVEYHGKSRATPCGFSRGIRWDTPQEVPPRATPLPVTAYRPMPRLPGQSSWLVAACRGSNDGMSRYVMECCRINYRVPRKAKKCHEMCHSISRHLPWHPAGRTTLQCKTEIIKIACGVQPVVNRGRKMP